MLNISQKKRLIIVAIIPLIIIGLWFSDQYRFFVPSIHYNALCTKSGDCSSFSPDTDFIFENLRSGGIYLDSFGGARLIGGINERIIFPTSSIMRTLAVPQNAMAEDGVCKLIYLEKGLINSKSEKVAPSDSFMLICGGYSQEGFRFAIQGVHDGFVSAIRNNSELRGKFHEQKNLINSKQTWAAIALFLAPFIIFFGIWAFISILIGLFRFVRYGRKP